jgi:hypothetical protein
VTAFGIEYTASGVVTTAEEQEDRQPREGREPMTVGLATTTLANKILDHLRGGTAWTQPAGIYVKLHTADPGAAGATAAAAGSTTRVAGHVLRGFGRCHRAHRYQPVVDERWHLRDPDPHFGVGRLHVRQLPVVRRPDLELRRGCRRTPSP